MIKIVNETAPQSPLPGEELYVIPVRLLRFGRKTCVAQLLMLMPIVKSKSRRQRLLRRRPAYELEINSPLNEYIMVIAIESACVCRVCATAFAPRRSCANDLCIGDYAIYLRECHITVNGYKVLASLSQLASVTRCCQASDIRFWRVPTTSYKPSHRHTHTHTVSSFSEKTPGGIPSTQIKRETQLKHLAINSFISMSHKQCYRSAAVAATTAAAAASVEAEAATASGARHASITPCCSCYAVILCLFSEQSHTKRRGTASHLKRDCSALLCSTSLCCEAIIAC